MPNGHDKNFVRLCAALDGFKSRYGKWPTRVVAWEMSIDDIRDYVLSRDDFEAVIQKVALVPGDAAFRAEDDEGNVYDYANEGFTEQPPRPSAREWLGVEVLPGGGFEAEADGS